MDELSTDTKTTYVSVYGTYDFTEICVNCGHRMGIHPVPGAACCAGVGCTCMKFVLRDPVSDQQVEEIRLSLQKIMAK